MITSISYSEMAEAKISVDRDQFSCSICLDLLKDPVTISCGHSYCMSCITDYWNDQMRVYTCPQCRQTFTPRPALGKNNILAEVVGKLKQTKQSRPAFNYAGPGDVGCDFCTGRKRKAVKSCLVCLESYCQNHFKCHEESPLKKRHKVTDATGRLQEMICPQHNRPLEVFCRTDQRCICLMCVMDEHKSHDTVPAEGERTEKQNFQSLSEHLESTDVSSFKVSSVLSYKDVRKPVTQLKEKLEKFCKEEMKKISSRVTNISIISSNEPKTREDFLQYSHQLTLDLNTVNKQVHLSEDNTVASYTDTVQAYPDHPDRFDVWPQVLCRESVCGRCYWEVESTEGMGISVSYKGIRRKGKTKDCIFGFNDQSWRLSCSASYSFLHNSKTVKLPVISSSSRIGVYVDHRAGILSFYSISDTMTLIHRIQTTFTQPLYLGFWLYTSTVKLCHIRE
ncbi:tripartite motif-containing protein 16-like isoform X2 [Chanodichthys erythropterus]|uniref:tripartite motif-containing protein 16-like isoform X2 n=1 Tax=Chanodichthys erythropterus TaxID=933992 RepID=UPI00351F34EB